MDTFRNFLGRILKENFAVQAEKMGPHFNFAIRKINESINAWLAHTNYLLELYRAIKQGEDLRNYIYNIMGLLLLRHSKDGNPFYDGDWTNEPKLYEKGLDCSLIEDLIPDMQYNNNENNHKKIKMSAGQVYIDFWDKSNNNSPNFCLIKKLSEDEFNFLKKNISYHDKVSWSYHVSGNRHMIARAFPLAKYKKLLDFSSSKVIESIKSHADTDAVSFCNDIMTTRRKNFDLVSGLSLTLPELSKPLPEDATEMEKKATSFILSIAGQEELLEALLKSIVEKIVVTPKGVFREDLLDEIINSLFELYHEIAF